jgi:hypothetical protein
VHTAHDLQLVDRATVGGFACTSASRTMLDLARDTPAPGVCWKCRKALAARATRCPFCNEVQ